MDKWAKTWLNEQRMQGTKCLEVKVIGTNHYVYHSTTYWDKELKKPRKTSKYLGKLDKNEGLIESRTRKELSSSDIRNVTEYGNSMILHESMKSLKPLLMDAFPDCWEEIYSLAMVRINGYVPMKRAQESWEKLYNVENIDPQLNPKSLSKVLHSVGINRVGQNTIFKKLTDQSNQLVYDLSSMFTRSMSIAQAEKGYNKDHLHVPQINLALLCSADTGLPAMIRSIPGSVRDIATLYNSIKEVDVKGKTLILDRGFFSDDILSLTDFTIF
jgi:transposase